MTYDVFIGDDAEKQMRRLPRDVLIAVDRLSPAWPMSLGHTAAGRL